MKPLEYNALAWQQASAFLDIFKKLHCLLGNFAARIFVPIGYLMFSLVDMAIAVLWSDNIFFQVSEWDDVREA